MKFIASTEGRNSLNLLSVAQAFADSQWIPAQCTPEQAAELVLGQFRRAVATEIELIEFRCEQETHSG